MLPVAADLSHLRCLSDYVGKLDCNCGWPGVLSMVRPLLSLDVYMSYNMVLLQLKLIPSQFQEEFIATPDTPWPDAETGSKRVVGAGSGNMTLILMEGAGHMVSRYHSCTYICKRRLLRRNLLCSGYQGPAGAREENCDSLDHECWLRLRIQKTGALSCF